MNWSPCYEYNRQNVQQQAQAAQGIYRLSISNRIFYIGKAVNLRRRLIEHLNPRATNHLVTRYLKKYRCFFRFALVESAYDLYVIERRQIKKYDPPCNIDIWTIQERPRRTVLSLKTGPVTLDTDRTLGGRRSQANELVSQVALALVKRPAGLCRRWAVGVCRGRIICVPYADRDRLRPAWLTFKDADADQNISPATWQRIRNQIQNALANGGPCHPDPDAGHADPEPCHRQRRKQCHHHLKP